MKKFLKNKKIIIYLLIILFAILLVAILNNNFKIIERIANGRLPKADEEKAELPLISYQVYDNSDENKIKTLVTINDNSGIEYIEYPDGTRIETNSKTQFSVDYNMTKDKNCTFKIKTKSNEQIQEQTVCANDEFINNNGVSISKINNENGYKVIDIEKENNLDGYKTYYQIGKNGSWIEGTGKLSLLDYDLVTNNLLNEDNTITINAKIENQTTKNTVNMTKKYKVETNVQNNSYSSESLLTALENDEIGTGAYKVTVENETYNLKVYSFDENLNIKVDTTIGTEEDVATASEYAKNMIVLKVNGDLTIDEGVTLTAYTSKNGYGGPKGMTIYCTGTLTNNGTISMTARGAKAEGEDVYLWKNTDNTYEFVPAVGANGGIGFKMQTTSKGRSGENGINRQTGGGGTGAIRHYDGVVSVSNAGNGTSYSGGTGSGGAANYNISSERGDNNGGKGGNAGVESRSGTTFSLAGGGAGNPTGNSANSEYKYYNQEYTSKVKNGTGGLLIIYSENLKNYGNIDSKGIGLGSLILRDKSNNSIKNGKYVAAGGSSGGGSINIFYNGEYINEGTMSVDGGNLGYSSNNGGPGGTGSISIGQLLNGTYTSTYTNY